MLLLVLRLSWEEVEEDLMPGELKVGELKKKRAIRCLG